MTDFNAQPVPALEETQANLANLDPRTARILRARLGLTPAELEPPKAEPPAPPPLDPDARAIDPDALQRLNAEIAENAKAEQEAAEASKRAKQEAAKRTAEPDLAIAAALEPIKTRARRLSSVKRRLEESAVRVMRELPAEVIYQHSVFCQTVLPYRDPGPEVRKWERQQGNALLQISAGEIADKQRQQFVPVGLPYGPAARLILAHLNTTALQTRDRTIEINSSMTAYIRRLSGRQACGRDINRFKEQLIRLSGCLIRIAYDLGERTIQVNSHIVNAFDLWEERFDGKRFLFPQTIALSADYFESLLAHAVPLDERAVAALAHSAMGLDVYMWLAQRLHRVDRQRAQFIPWTALYAQFGQGYKHIRQFRAAFLGVLKAVKTQYPTAHVKTDKGGMLLANSPPPVPSRHAILLPPANPLKG